MKRNRLLPAWTYAIVCALLPALAHAERDDCGKNAVPSISFVQFTSLNIQAPATPLTVKGKLSLPVGTDTHSRCFPAARTVPAVVILHGSSGVDARGDFH